MLSWPNPHDGSLSWKATLLCDLISLLKHWRLLVDITCQNCTHGHRIHVLMHIIKYVKMHMHSHTMKQMMDIHISMIIDVIRFCMFFPSFRFHVMNKEAAADGTRRRPAIPPRLHRCDAILRALHLLSGHASSDIIDSGHEVNTLPGSPNTRALWTEQSLGLCDLSSKKLLANFNKLGRP